MATSPILRPRVLEKILHGIFIDAAFAYEVATATEKLPTRRLRNDRDEKRATQGVGRRSSQGRRRWRRRARANAQRPDEERGRREIRPADLSARRNRELKHLRTIFRCWPRVLKIRSRLRRIRFGFKC